MSTKDTISRLDVLIAQFRELVQQYPLVEAYKESLRRFEADRAEIASRIGR